MAFTCLFTSAGILHGLHSDEALAALRPGQQSLLVPAAAWRRTVPAKPAIQLAASAQIPDDHAGEEPNGHGRHAVYSAAGTSTRAHAPPAVATWLRGGTCDVQARQEEAVALVEALMRLRTSF